MNAKQKEVYWAEYIRNQQSIWIGEKTESLINKELIQDKIKQLTTMWTLVGNGWQKIIYKKLLNIHLTKIIFPNAKDIIPFVLLEIQNNKNVYSTKNSTHYLCNYL